jgi:hypothetical protein
VQNDPTGIGQIVFHLSAERSNRHWSDKTNVNICILSHDKDTARRKVFNTILYDMTHILWYCPSKIQSLSFCSFFNYHAGLFRFRISYGIMNPIDLSLGSLDEEQVHRKAAAYTWQQHNIQLHPFRSNLNHVAAHRYRIWNYSRDYEMIAFIYWINTKSKTNQD